MRLLLRIVFLVFALALLGVGAALAWFSSWRTDQLANIYAASTLADTAAGAVEFLQENDGPALLIFHGAPGGCDQALLLGNTLTPDDFQLIAPSRPGYLRTPLATGLSPEQQADAMAALLDTLGTDHVAVLGVSAGAPAAIEFCLRYPTRAWALVLMAPVVKKVMPTAEIRPLPLLLNERLTGDIGSWYLVHSANANPGTALDWMFDLAQLGDETARTKWTASVRTSENQLTLFRDLTTTLAPLGPRETGLKNDLLQLRALPDLPFENLLLPTLIVHGIEDSFIPIADVQAVAKRIPNAELIVVPKTGHFPLLGPDSADVPNKVREFLSRFHGGQTAP